nr:hypothetical protein [Anaerolineae bacterium]
MPFQAILLNIHSWVRWLVMLVALAVVVKHVIGLVKKAPYDRVSKGLTVGFSGLMGLNALVGVVQLIVGWQALTGVACGFPNYQIEHVTVMLIAVVTAHLPTRWKHLPDSLRYHNGIIAVAGAILMVFMATAVLEGSRWGFRGLGE